MSGLYHYQLGLPVHVDHLLKDYDEVWLEYGNHAKRAAKSDRYGKIDLPMSIHLSSCLVVEAEIKYNEVRKIVVRMKYDNVHDLCLVIVPLGKSAWFVKTVWLNKRSDKHSTLDKRRYIHAHLSTVGL